MAPVPGTPHAGRLAENAGGALAGLTAAETARLDAFTVTGGREGNAGDNRLNGVTPPLR